MCFWTACVLPWALQAQAQYVDPSLNWRTLETAHFALHFAEQYRAQAQLAARVAEAVYPRVTAWLRWEPESKTQLLLIDSLDVANGFSTPQPFNAMGIVLSPPDEGELLQNRDWLELVLTHEFTHIVHMDKATRAPLVLRRVFGRFPFLFPNVLEPSWLIEGLATYAESDASRGWGRLGRSFYEGMMRAESARGLLSLRELNAGGRGFPHNRDYLYGSYFFAFLAQRYGEAALADYVENYSGNLIPFRVHSAPRSVTDKAMDELWLEYQDWLRERFAARPGRSEARADAVNAVPMRAFSLTSPLLTPTGERWFVRASGYTRAQLVRQRQDGKEETLREVEPGTRLAALPQGGVLLSMPEICANYNVYYDLYRVEANGAMDRLTRCGRFRLAAVLEDGSIAALRVVAREAELVLLNRDGGAERSLYRFAPGEAPSGLAARGGKIAVTSLRDERWSLLEIADGKATVLLSDAAYKHTPRFSDSGDDIYFVADYDNVAEVWSWQRAGQRLARWTQTPNGVREISAPLAGQMLIATIEADGDALRQQRLPDAPLAQRAASTPQAGAARAEPPVQLALPERSYSPWSSLLPRTWFPAVQSADGALALGAQTYGQDALGLHSYALSSMYEFTQREPLVSAAYDYDGRHGVLAERTLTVKASSAKSSGGSASSSSNVDAYNIHESAQWVSTWRHLSFDQRYYWGLGGALDRDRLHVNEQATALTRDERVLGLVAGVDTRRGQYLSEGPSQGQQLRLFAETSNGLRGAYSGNVYRADWRGHVPLGRTVLSLRWNEAYAQPEAQPFQLGGSFSEETAYVQPGLPRLNQREFPLRGYLSGEAALTGHHARLGSVELRIPLSDVDRHFMLPPVGFNRVSMNLFFDAGSAWDSGAAQRYYRGAGVEARSELRLGYQYGVQLSAGLARGLDAPGKTVGYLRVGRSF